MHSTREKRRPRPHHTRRSDRRRALHEVLEDRSLLTVFAFQIDPNESSLALLAAGVTSQSGGTAGTIASYQGELRVDLDNRTAPTELQIVDSLIAANVSGTWAPGDYGGPGSAPADYGVVFGGNLAIRNLQFTASSDAPVDVSPTGTFATDATAMRITSGTLDSTGVYYDLTATPPMTVSVASSSLTVDSNGIATLRINLDAAVELYPDQTVDFAVDTHFQGVLVATAYLAPETFVVTNTLDSGPGSLRQAIMGANASIEPEAHIEFQIPANDPGFVDVDATLAGGDAEPDVFVISPTTPLPPLSNSNARIVIDGTSQAAFTGDTNPLGPEIVLDGQLAGLGATGLQLLSANNVIDSLVISHFSGDGIDAVGDNAAVLRSFIGTDATGQIAQGQGGNGITISGPSSQIGAPTIGNVISGNDGDGVLITGAAAVLNTIAGNQIGTSPTGTPLGNTGAAVRIDGGAQGNTIGGTSAASGNRIAYNADGVVVVDGRRNPIWGNSISDNAGLGIDLGADGPTPNDSDDSDTGPNDLQNYPLLSIDDSDPDAPAIDVKLPSASDARIVFEVFAAINDSPPTLIYHADLVPSAAASGVLVPIPSGAQQIFATATDIDENTSEFSPPLVAAGDDHFSVDENTSTELDVLLNDSSPDGDPIEIISVDGAPHGSAVPAPDQQSIIYTPDSNFSGHDQFTYTIEDMYGLMATATVDVTVVRPNHLPVANDDYVTVFENSGPTAINVLANDFDPDDDPLTIVGATNGTNGDTVIRFSDHVNYAPPTNFVGTDTFTYTIDDGHGGQATATVYVTVVRFNLLPVANDDYVTVNENSGPTAINVLANDSDPDGDPLTIVDVSGAEHGQPTAFADHVDYMPAANYFGPDEFTYTIDDGHGGQATATVYVTVTRTLNRDPIAVNDYVTVDENSGPTAINVLANDSDPDGDPLTIVDVSGAEHGQPTAFADHVDYMPAANYFGPDEFTYTIDDGHGGQATATVYVTVTRTLNRDPIAEDDYVTVEENSGLTAIYVLTNDSDPDDDPLTVVGATNGTNGDTVMPLPDHVNYAPPTNFIGLDTFTYTIDDGQGGQATATVYVTVVRPIFPPMP